LFLSILIILFIVFGGAGPQKDEGANKESPQNDKENDEYGEEHAARKNNWRRTI
jgi:hypothetical protein